MKGLLLRALHIITNGLTSEYCIAAYLLSQEICRLRRKSGLLFAALYLKQCNTVLMKYYGGVEYPPELLTPQVSLSRGGLPRIIPSFHRNIIKNRGDRGDVCVKIYLSWFSLARIVLLAPRVTKETFASLRDGFPDIESSVEFIHSLHFRLRLVLDRYMPFHTTIPLYQGMVWEPTWKSTPNMQKVKGKGFGPSLYTALCKEMAVFDHIISYQGFDTEEERLDSILNLKQPLTLYSGDPRDCEGREIAKMSTSEDIMWLYYEFIARGIDVLYGSKFSIHQIERLNLARVSAIMAGAGKRRLFVMANYGIQRLLRPFHDWCMSVLRRLPSDGTFDQLKPIKRVIGLDFVASFDLKSATDRWPRHFMTVVFCNIWGSRLAAQITECCLGAIGVTIGPPVVKRRFVTSCTVGTLLGYYCAWPLFALSHHILVWCAAEAVYPGKLFRAYGVLGDDVIIGDRRVAEEYKQMLSKLGVKISESKSLISTSGAFEFAKKFYINRGSFDCSPVSMKVCLLTRSILGLTTIKRTYNISNLCTVLRLAGSGYRVTARLSPNLLKGRWSRIDTFLSYDPNFSELTFEWWLGGWSCPLNPYLKGTLVHWLLFRVRPKQLLLPPHEAFSEEEDPDLVLEYSEYTITRCWLAQWLRYLLWFSVRQAKGWSDLTDLLEPPVVETTWYRREVDHSVYRFGNVWRIYNMVLKARKQRMTFLALSPGASGSQVVYPVIWKLHVSN